jgi:hypothetical protein
MKRLVILLALVAFAWASAQVSSAEILGIDDTRPHSAPGTALIQDGSVGEVTVRVRALDGGGNPVANAPVVWTLTNRTDRPAFVVGGGEGWPLGLIVFGRDTLTLEGMTDADGVAYLVVDAQTAGDVSIAVRAGDVDAKTYDGNNMRVVWF